jgi:hypothetical protein
MGSTDLVTRHCPHSLGLIRAFLLADEAKQSLSCLGYADGLPFEMVSVHFLVHGRCNWRQFIFSKRKLN